MTKKDLMTGDIIVNRSGYLGVILKDEDMVLYQTIGSDMLFEFNDDLTFDDEDYRDGDIMQVYRGNTFWDVDNDEDAPFYQRDYNWHRPSAEEREKVYREYPIFKNNCFRAFAYTKNLGGFLWKY